MLQKDKGLNSNGLMTFSEHLDVFRKMLYRIFTLIFGLSIIFIFLKEPTFRIILAPSKYNFITYETIENIIQLMGFNFKFQDFHVKLISTELSSQFMTHITTSIYLGVICSSPYIIFSMFKFISPALYERERKFSIPLIIVIYILFIMGLLMSYFILFPISFRFLGTYTVSETIQNTITLRSYISTFLSLSLIMGIVFQLPIITFILGKFRLVTSYFLSKYRKHALILIMLIAAIITPPDIMTLFLVTVPLYLLYELSIRILKHIE